MVGWVFAPLESYSMVVGVGAGLLETFSGHAFLSHLGVFLLKFCDFALDSGLLSAAKLTSWIGAGGTYCIQSSRDRNQNNGL